MKVADLFADLHLDDKAFFKELDDALARASAKSVKIKIDADTAAAQSKIDKLAADRKVKIKVDADTAAANAEIDKLKLKIDSLSSIQRVGVAGGGSGAGGGGALGALLGLSPAIAPLLATTAGGLTAIAGAATFAGAGVGAFAAIAKTQFGAIAESLKDVKKAQEQADVATTSATRATALQKEALAYQGLTSGQLGVAKGVQRLSADWKDLNKQLERPVLVDFNGALTIARHGLDYIGPLALNAAGALKEVENRVDHALGNPYWKSFGRLLTAETGPAIHSLTTDLGNLAHGFAGLVTAFLPVTHQIEAGLEHMTGSFAGLGQSKGLRSFVSYVQAEGPVVVHQLGDIAKAFGVILKDALPIGSVLLDLVDDLAKLITTADSVNPVIVTLSVGLLSIAKLAPLLTSAGKGFANFLTSLRTANPYAIAAGVAIAGVAGYMTVLHNESTKAKTAIDDIHNSFNAFDTSKAERSIQALTVQLEGTKTTIAQMRFKPDSILGHISEFGQNINPLVDNSVSRTKDNLKEQTKELALQKVELASVADNFAAVEYKTGKTKEQVEALAKATGLSLETFKTDANDFADQNAVVEAFREIDKQAGVAQGTITGMAHVSIVQMQELAKAVQTAADKTATAFGGATDIISNFQVQAQSASKASVATLTGQLMTAQAKFAKLQAEDRDRAQLTVAQQTALAKAHDKVTAATSKLAQAQQAAKTPAEQLRDAYRKTLDNATSFVRDTASAIDRGLDPQLIERLLEAGPQKAEPILQALLSDHSGKTIALANSTEKALQRISSQAVQYARVTALAVASPTDKLAKELPSIAKVLQAQLSLGGKANVVTIAAKLDTSPTHVAQLARDFGVTVKGASQYITSQGVKVPIHYSYPANGPGSSTWKSQVPSQAVKINYRYQAGVKPGGVIEATPVQVVQVKYNFPALVPGGSVYSSQVPSVARAGGGKVYGPGTATSDSILARLSNGEGVVNARSMSNLERMGVTIDKLNSYATGGIVGLPALLPGIGGGTNLATLPTGGYAAPPVYGAALAGAEGSLRAFLASALQFIQRDLPAALQQGAAGVASAGQSMIDQLAALRDQYQSLTAANTKAQSDLKHAQGESGKAAKGDLKDAKKAAEDAANALAKLGHVGDAVKSSAAFRSAEASIATYTRQLEKAANQNQALADKIDIAKTNLETAKDAFRQYREQIKASITALGDFTAMQATIIDQKAVDALSSSANDLTKNLSDAQSAYDAALGTKQSDALESLTTAQDVYNASVEKYGANSANAIAAQNDLTAAQQRAADAASKLSAAQSALQSGQALLTAAQNGRAVSGADILGNVRSQVAAARHYSDNIKKLRNAGLSKTAIQQILNAGPATGAAFAEALASDLGDIGQLNQLQGQLDTIGQDLGATAAGWFNQSGIDAAQGILDGLKTKQAALQDAMKSLGQELAKAFKDALGIHSPSRVFHDLAVQVPAGVVSGIESGRDDAVRASRGLARSIVGGYAGTAGPMTSAPGSVGAGGSTGPVVNIERVEVASPTDASILLQQLDFFAAHSGRTR